VTPVPRCARGDDLSSIADLDRRRSPVLPNAQAYARLLAHDGLILVVDAGEHLAGFAALSKVLDEATLLNLVVDDAHRRRGIGAALVEAAVARLAAGGIRRLLLEVRASNSAARALYTRAGFGEDGWRRGYYAARDGRAGEDALLMSRSLEPVARPELETGR
jgi:ribosomal-protein-alanine N-acetyltransferase